MLKVGHRLSGIRDCTVFDRWDLVWNPALGMEYFRAFVCVL
jgi:hypothetical protein